MTKQETNRNIPDYTTVEVSLAYLKARHDKGMADDNLREVTYTLWQAMNVQDWYQQFDALPVANPYPV